MKFLKKFAKLKCAVTVNPAKWGCAICPSKYLGSEASLTSEWILWTLYTAHKLIQPVEGDLLQVTVCDQILDAQHWVRQIISHLLLWLIKQVGSPSHTIKWVIVILLETLKALDSVGFTLHTHNTSISICFDCVKIVTSGMHFKSN